MLSENRKQERFALQPSVSLFRKAEFDLLYKLEPYANLLRFPDISSDLIRKRAARLQELIHFCCTADSTKEEIDRAFKQFVFESLQLTCTDPTGYIMQPHLEDLMSITNPWDDPYPFFKTLREMVKDEITPPWEQRKRRRSESVLELGIRVSSEDI